jgi:HAD superfamily hydrolase (TIGR01509 family)
MNIRAVIFDFDGVLVDSEQVNIEAGVRGFADFGFDLTQADKAIIVGRHSQDYSKILREKYCLPETISDPLLAKIAEEYDRTFEGFIRLQPGVKETLNYLREKKILLSIATANRRRSVETFMNKFNLQDYFGFIISNENITKRKPDPEIYLAAKNRLDLPDNQIIAVEDTEIGVEAAKGAGLVCVAIPNQHTKDHGFSKADYVFKSIKEITMFFNEENNPRD